MFIDKGPAAVIQAQAFLDAVAQHETTVIHADHRLRLGNDLTIQINQDLVIARVFFGLMCGHVILHLESPFERDAMNFASPRQA